MNVQPSRTRRFVAALESYDMRRDPVDHVLDRALPVELGLVHAVSMYGPRSPVRQPRFLDRFSVEEALCGKRVRVLLPITFRAAEDDIDQCARCCARLRTGATGPPAHRRYEDASDASDGTGIPPSTGHVWTGRTWTFGATEEVPWEGEEQPAG